MSAASAAVLGLAPLAGYQIDALSERRSHEPIGVPDGIRTRVTAVKGRMDDVTRCKYRERVAPTIPQNAPRHVLLDGY